MFEIAAQYLPDHAAAKGPLLLLAARSKGEPAAHPVRRDAPEWLGLVTVAYWKLYWKPAMNPFSIAKNSWQAGDTREVEQDRLRKEIGVEYDSYRRIYIADGSEWSIVGQIAREDGKKYYILECVG